MRSGKFCGQLFLPRFRPLAINELKEIETDSDSVDANQTGDVFDVIDVTIESALLFRCTDEHGIHADYAAPFSDHLDLFIGDVSLDVVIATDICVGHDQWLCCNRENFVKPGRIDMRQINHHTEPLAFAHYIASKRGKAFERRTGRGKNSAVSRRVASRMCETD